MIRILFTLSLLEYLLLHFLKEIDKRVKNSSNILELVTELPKIKVLKNGMRSHCKAASSSLGLNV